MPRKRIHHLDPVEVITGEEVIAVEAGSPKYTQNLTVKDIVSFGLGNSSGLQYFSESINDSTVFLNVIGQNANVGLSLVPKGIGPFYLGNDGAERGIYAVDLQLDRAKNSQVAAGERSTIGGGVDNTASGNISFIGGGESNSAEADHSAVIGGKSNKTRQLYSSICGGADNLTEARYSCVLGGYKNQSSQVAEFSALCGRNALASNRYEFAQGAGTFEGNDSGQAQASRVVVPGRDYFYVPLDHSWLVEGKTVAVEDSGLLKSWKFMAVFQNKSGTIIQNFVEPIAEIGNSGLDWSIAIAATGNNRMRINMTSGLEVRWLSLLDVLQIK